MDENLTLEQIQTKLGELDIAVAEQQSIAATANAEIAKLGIDRAKYILRFSQLRSQAPV